MSRKTKLHLELNGEHMTLRIILVGFALLIAVIAFGSGIREALAPKTGWQQIEPAKSETGIAQDFMLYYNIGQSQRSASAEEKALSAMLGQTLDEAYRRLSNVPAEGYVNLYTLNSQPNTAIAVDPLLYAAFQQVAASGSRLPYFAPLLGMYRSLYSCTYDEEAKQFDPRYDREQEAFVREIAGFAMDPEAVQVKLLPENTLRLEVSPAYLEYARQNDVTDFVDFGELLNAFLCDALADEMAEQGLVNGYVTSFDGYTRVLCPEQFGLNLLDFQNGKRTLLGTALYQGPCSLVSCRSFPTMEQDQLRYYGYSDGSVLGPYLNEQGALNAACASLTTRSETLSVAQLALRTLDAYAGTDTAFYALDDLSWVSTQDGQIHYHGEGFRPAASGR